MPQQNTPAQQEPWYRQSWVKPSAVIAASILGFMLVVVAVVAVMWNYSSQKALYDAMSYVVKTPGTYHVVSKDTDLTVVVGKDEKYALSGKAFDATFEAIINHDLVYFKSPDLLRFMREATKGIDDKTFKQLSDPLKGQWITMSLSNPPLQMDAISSINCVIDSRQTLGRDSAAWGELLTTFGMHPIFTVTTPKKSTYRLTYDNTKAEGFFDSLINTEAYANTTGCSSVIRKDFFNELKGTSVSMELSEPSHAPTSITLNGSDGSQTKIKPDYRSVPNIEVPEKAVNVQQIASSLLMTMFMQSFDR